MKKIITLFWIGIFFFCLYLPKAQWFSKKQPTLHIFTWPDFYDVNNIYAFEKETGIKVELSYFTSNEEMLIKLRSNNGHSYDLITPSDYAINLLIKQGALAPIDKSKVEAYKHFYPFLMGQYFDPKNRYTLPAIWEVYGIGYYKEIMDGKPIQDFSPLFEPHKDYKITMVPDPVEALCFASFHLFGSIDSLDKKQLRQVKDLLIKQKQWVEAYVDDRSKYLFSTENSKMALFKSSLFMQVDYSNTDKEIDFVLPQKGSFITIESYAIPKQSSNQDLVYKFLNYIYRPENTVPHIERAHLYPVDPRVLPLLDESKRYFETIEKARNHPNLQFFKHLLTEQDTRSTWVEVKSQ